MDVIDFKKIILSPSNYLKANGIVFLASKESPPRKDSFFTTEKTVPIVPTSDQSMICGWCLSETGKTVDPPVIILWYQSRFQWAPDKQKESFWILSYVKGREL